MSNNRHQHLIVRAEVQHPPRPEDCASVEQWLRDLIADIDMKILAEPRARYCDVVDNRGMTADALLETSHVMLHSWDECFPAVVQFDLYTCSDLPLDQVFYALGRFSPIQMEYKFLDRENQLVVVRESVKNSRLRNAMAFLRRLIGR